MNLTQTVLILIMIGSISSLEEGEDCTLEINGRRGICISVYECEEAKRILQSHQRPQHCGFNRETELVCCPIRSGGLQQKRTASKSDEMCREYYLERKLDLIVAIGEQAGAREFPHMAAIGFSNGRTILWLCGGSLVSDRYVLTAAHCTNSREYGAPEIVRLGDLDLISDSDDAYPTDIPIENIHINPLFQSPSVYHDIALLELKEPQRFSLYVKPACLHLDRNLPTDFLQVVGWGKTDFFSEGSSHLMKANLSVVNHQRCTERFPRDSVKFKDGILDEMQICAGDSQGKDTCPGYSGGPLHFQRQCENCSIGPHFAVVGITSFGKACGTKESVGVYLRVAPYAGWIENIVWG